jgi:glyoxylase-like metal-dependent hydrolase (beta-lactamase superfamily II)
LDTLIFKQLKAVRGDNFAYVIGDRDTKDASVVDPDGAVTQVKKILKDLGLRLVYVVNTHGHSDHTSGNRDLASLPGVKVAAHVDSPIRKDVSLGDGDTLFVGKVEMRVLHTPGHTRDSICILADGKLMTGDTLFVGECGRTDLPGGDAEQLYNSLFGKIVKLDDSIEVYPGHDYGQRPSSTIGFEKENNYTLQPRTLAEFIDFMSEP